MIPYCLSQPLLSSGINYGTNEGNRFRSGSSLSCSISHAELPPMLFQTVPGSLAICTTLFHYPSLANTGLPAVDVFYNI